MYDSWLAPLYRNEPRRNLCASIARAIPIALIVAKTQATTNSYFSVGDIAHILARGALFPI
jgi:hypothetical protein